MRRSLVITLWVSVSAIRLCPHLGFRTKSINISSRTHGGRINRALFSHDALVRLQRITLTSTHRQRMYMTATNGGGMREPPMFETEGDLPSKSTGNWLRTLASPEFSVALGASILLAVLTNRISTSELIDSQARTDILGVIASGGLITNGIYQLDLNIQQAEEVTLVGRFIQEYDTRLASRARQDLQWLAESLLLASPATSVLVYRQGEILARVGIMGESPIIEEAPILKKSLEGGGDGRELYLPALQVLPGKVEFDYLPENCQGVIMQPVLDGTAVVIMGTNRARAFTPKDIVWMRGLCDQGTLSLRQQLSAIV